MTIAIVWFRRDLRLTDNPALSAAAREASSVIPLYVDPRADRLLWSSGGASRWWLHHSLQALDADLRERGSRLIIRSGTSLTALRSLVRETGATRIFWNRLYEPSEVARDREIEQSLKAEGLDVASGNAALLREPWTILTRKDRPYRVFTLYYRAMRGLESEPAPEPAPDRLPPLPGALPTATADSLELLPKAAWDQGLRAVWKPGAAGALERLDAFLHTALADYAEQRNRPDLAGTSRLSPHLHFGEIGPRQIVAAIRQRLAQLPESAFLAQAEVYLRQLIWREFAVYLLYHFPHSSDGPLDQRFQHFPWNRDGTAALRAWQRGRTGFPIVDAGMRELWHTGWMHNRVRMLAASVLTKNLRISWIDGARWFWDTLVDADLANNTLGWQWTAGCGADAAPYYRIFNPVLQGERYDPEGTYVRRWVPELRKMPASHIHRPWQAPPAMLHAAGVALGESYPLPVADLQRSRAEAREAFSSILRPPAV